VEHMARSCALTYRLAGINTSREPTARLLYSTPKLGSMLGDSSGCTMLYLRLGEDPGLWLLSCLKIKNRQTPSGRKVSTFTAASDNIAHCAISSTLQPLLLFRHCPRTLLICLLTALGLNNAQGSTCPGFELCTRFTLSLRQTDIAHCAISLPAALGWRRRYARSTYRRCVREIAHNAITRVI